MKRRRYEQETMNPEKNDSAKIRKAVSIVMAIRNEEAYIRKCLDSLINQNFVHSKYEIIVVDGMSDDKTPEIVAECRTRFPDLIKTLDNQKKIQAAGRNLG